MTDLSEIACGAFSPLIGAELVLEREDGSTLVTKVASATEYPKSTPPDARRTAFSVILHAPETCTDGEGNYTLVHPDLGRVGPVFVVRIHPAAIAPTEASFQIAFN